MFAHAMCLIVVLFAGYSALALRLFAAPKSRGLTGWRVMWNEGLTHYYYDGERLYSVIKTLSGKYVVAFPGRRATKREFPSEAAAQQFAQRIRA